MASSSLPAILSAFLSLAALAHARTKTGDLIGLYEKFDASAFMKDRHCPSTLRFQSFAFDQFADSDFAGFDYFNIKIDHDSTKIGSSTCSSQGSMWAAESGHPARVSKKDMLDDWATAHGNKNRSYIAGNAFMDMAQDVNFIFGYDYVQRTCGKKSVRAGTAYLWIEFPASVDVHEKFEMEKGVKYMLMTHTDWGVDHGCIYTAAEVGGDGSQDEGPTSDPSRDEDFEMAADAEEDDDEDKPKKKKKKGEEKKKKKVTRVTEVEDEGITFSGATDPEPKKESKCFPSSALVTLSSGQRIPMRDLATGDNVAVGGGLTSTVFMHTHKDHSTGSAFVTLRTASGHVLTATAGHYIYVNGALAPASSAAVGDELTLASGAHSAVVEVGESVEDGLYNPQTLHGDIVVDGVLASTYTTAVEPALANALLAPARALYRAGCGGWLGGLLHGGVGEAASRWLPAGGASGY